MFAEPISQDFDVMVDIVLHPTGKQKSHESTGNEGARESPDENDLQKPCASHQKNDSKNRSTHDSTVFRQPAPAGDRLIIARTLFHPLQSIGWSDEKASKHLS